jgi:hypothetical protein
VALAAGATSRTRPGTLEPGLVARFDRPGGDGMYIGVGTVLAILLIILLIYLLT